MAGTKDCQNELTYSETKKDTENQYRSMLRQKEQAQKNYQNDSNCYF